MPGKERDEPESTAEEALQVTIATYDATAARYAQQTLDIHLSESLRWFADHLPARARVLDAGCGPGRDIVWLRALGYDAVGMDLSMEMLRQAVQRVPEGLINGDLTALPFGDRSFQGIWACASLLHLPKPYMERSLAELRRVLDAGVLFVAVKSGSGDGYIASSSGYRRYFVLYSLDELAHLVEEHGFEVIEARERQDATRPDTIWIHMLARPAADTRSPGRDWLAPETMLE